VEEEVRLVVLTSIAIISGYLLSHRMT
jgi:hypothetical protein